MPKNPEVTIITPRDAVTQASRLVSRESFASLAFWNDLKPREQEALYEAGNQLNAARIVHGSSGLAIGQHLTQIHNLLQNYTGAFDRFLGRLHVSRRTAYRYMEQYQEAVGHFSEPVIRAAMARGMKIPGKYAEAIEHLPPPHHIPENLANEYLQSVIEKKRELMALRKEGKLPPPEGPVPLTIRDPEELKKQAYRLAKNSMKTLTTRQRRRWFESFVGMLLTELGIGGAVSFHPEAIPEDFRQGRGRPRLQSAS